MGPPWPKHPCTDSHQARMQMESTTEQSKSAYKLQGPKIQIEDGWLPVYCSDVKSSTEQRGCIIFSLYETENRKHLFAEYTREMIDVRSPILLRRVKGEAHYEISTLSLRDASPSELRFLAFTSISELQKFKVKAVADKETIAGKELSGTNSRQIVEAVPPPKRKVQYDPNREVKVTVIGRRSKVVDEVTDENKIRLERNLQDEQALINEKEKWRAEVMRKREERKSKREAREREEKNKIKPGIQTALELAFAKAEGSFLKY